MLIFIDESGDTGFKVQKGSSVHFVISLVIFDDDLDAEETAVKIKRFKKSLNKSEKFEFKFNKCNKDLRTKFLNEVKNCNFRIRSIVLNKDVLYSKNLRERKELFYNFALKNVIEYNSGTIKNAKIRLDGRGERIFRQQLSLYLRKYLNSKTKTVMKNLRFRDSKDDVLIQLADMVAGSLRRYYDQINSDWSVYWKIIKLKSEDVWEFH